MTNLDREFCISVRNARRERGISQSMLAKEVGCKQSALSMFEAGDGTKLNDETVLKLAEYFGLEIPRENAPAAGDAAVPNISRPFANTAIERGFCPNPNCPTNKRYTVEDRIFARPAREECDPAGGKFCAICGEVLEKRCPNCGAHLHEGGVCSFCGEPYVAIPV